MHVCCLGWGGEGQKLVKGSREQGGGSCSLQVAVAQGSTELCREGLLLQPYHQQISIPQDHVEPCDGGDLAPAPLVVTSPFLFLCPQAPTMADGARGAGIVCCFFRVFFILSVSLFLFAVFSLACELI